ncbi:MAG: hypothetical protein U0840_16110 [Gemmataceae bacterium]
MAKKTNCPISRSQFREHAKPVVVMINDQKLVADAKEFSTGSLGWYVNAKVTVDINGITVPVQVGMNLTLVGSKELPKDAESPSGSDSAASSVDEGAH